MRYFRNDKLDLVNREKQRFGFRKLSSGKIASVLLGVTIFGSFALNGQVVKADTPTDGSQTSAAVDEPKSTQNNKGQGATATFNKEEQSRQDNSAQNYGSYNSLPITSEGGEETTEAGTGNPQAGSTGTDTQNANGGGTTSDTNGAGAAKGIRTRALVLAQYAAIPKDGQRTAQKQLTAQELVDKYKSNNLDLEHAQEFVDYYNNLNSITKILDLKATDYGSEWFERVLSGDVPRGVNNDFVKRLVSKNNEQMVKDTQAKIDKRIENLQDLSNQYPNNQEIKDAINNLRDAKNSVTVDNITNANAMKNAIGTLDKYGSKQAYDKLKQDAEKVNKDDLQSAVNEAATVKAANSQASEDKQKAYQDAIAAGKAVINDGKASQADVNTALSKIEQAKKDMTVSAIQKAVDEASDTKGKPNYYNASDEAKKAYNDALDKANRVLADPKATQDQLDEANSALTSAKEGLTGVATDNSGLEKAVNEANTTKLDDKYYNASQDKKQAYDEALAQATKLLNDKNASQKAVAEAVANLEKAKAELNGEPNFIGGDYTPSEPSTPSTETPAEKTTEKILMHAAYLYDNKGIKLDKPTVKSYVTVVVAENPVIINGIKYYKVAGKDEYIKAENIDGTLRVITHNSYIYNNKGKATRNKGIKRLVKKTRIVRTYGAPINIKGHMMYRIGKNRYIKARNFEGTLRRLSHNSFVYDENGKATRNKGIRRLLKKSRVVRTFDAPVKIKGHMMYRVDNGYIKVKNIK
ncbi:SLAP domain-containing protein [Lactobacillus sp. UMNPBX12]|uniref:SLAP domain-containing protein n=1 Tax=Lactobacillus sp. UMNPBX12 TaxID=2042035 RepID=UPI0013040DBD|nr:SLAP domain-containing protein [Lactobacillus sp. UMNPBX12]